MSDLVLNGKPFKGIKNLIFDLGGVIIGIDYFSTINKFKELGIENFDSLYGQFKQTNLFDLYEKGLIAPAQFRESIQQIGGIQIENDLFDNAWNAMILEMPSKNPQLLQNLKLHFNTYLLSNTNEIHLEHFFKYVDNEHDIKDFDQFFHKTYYSCRMSMRKPDVEIFQKIIDENHLIPEETLFIDDTFINLEGALQTNIQAYHLQAGEQICDLFSEYI